MFTHTHNRMLASKPHAFHIDIMCQVPDLFWRVYSICIICVHDACIVENDIDATPGVEVRDHSCDIRFFRDVTFDGLETGRLGKNLVDFGMGFSQCWFGYVGHENCGAFPGEEDGCLEADAAGKGICKLVWEESGRNGSDIDICRRREQFESKFE